jgi:hypothetical protein
MVFLFPGVLFRKFYFSGQFGNQFEQGNLLERFLWSLFLSLVCLSSVSLLFFILGYFWNLHPLENINYDKISSIFQNLARNEFPKSFTDKIEFRSFLILIFIIYFISASLGYIIHIVIRTLAFDRFSIFKFKNNWHYLSQAYKENGVNRKIGDVYTTLVDVLVKNNTKDELYQGILNNFILDKEDKLENIVLSKAYKFVSIEKSENESKIDDINESINNGENLFTLHRNYTNKIVYKKSIDGNLLVLPKDNIININFTYVKTSNKVKYWKTRFFGLLTISYLLIIVMLVILPFLEIKVLYFNSLWKKFAFSATTFLVLSIIINLIEDLLKIKIAKNATSLKDKIFIIILFSTPYLWIFNLITGIYTVLLFFIILFILIAIQNNDKKT